MRKLEIIATAVVVAGRIASDEAPSVAGAFTAQGSVGADYEHRTVLDAGKAKLELEDEARCDIQGGMPLDRTVFSSRPSRSRLRWPRSVPPPLSAP
jgi:hypothetical protein